MPRNGAALKGKNRMAILQTAERERQAVLDVLYHHGALQKSEIAHYLGWDAYRLQLAFYGLSRLKEAWCDVRDNKRWHASVRHTITSCAVEKRRQAALFTAAQKSSAGRQADPAHTNATQSIYRNRPDDHAPLRGQRGQGAIGVIRCGHSSLERAA